MKTMFGFCLVDAQPNEWRQKLKTKINIRIMNDTKGNSSTNDKKKPLPSYAISYLRFSSVVQGKGDSSRRQNAARDRWLDAHPDIPLKKEMNDLGLSAFRGKHVAKGDLGDFLALCVTEEFRAETKRRDVYLLVESLDRLSRERPFKAAHQLEEILAGGVKVVTLCDGKTFDENSLDNIGDVIKAICSMAIAHEEVARKSKRIKESWVGRYEKAKSGEIISRNLPAWLEMKNGRPVKRSKVVVHIRRIYELAASGVPKTEIAHILNRKKVPTLNDLKGRKQKSKTYWQDVSIGKILTGKAVLGTLETVHGDVENYYPAIIDPALRAKVLRICRTHKSNRGRQTDNYTNLLRKIGFDCQTGDPIYCTQTRTGGNFRNYYMSKAVRHGADGIRWKGGGPRGFEEALLESMRIALHLENNIDNLKEDLDLKEHAYAETTASIEKLVDFIDSGDMEIEEIRERLVELRKVKAHHEQEILELKDNIKASDVKQLIDLESGSRRDVYHCIRANVARVDLNCEKRWFRIVLQNGKIYEADYSKCIDSMVKIDASTSIKSEVGLLSVNKAA